MKEYKVYSWELQLVGTVQLLTSISAAVGTFFGAVYYDRLEEMKSAKAVATAAKRSIDADPLVQSIQQSMDQAWWTAAAFFGLAIVMFLIQGMELSRIRSEHQEPTLWGLVRNAKNWVLTKLGA